MATVLTVCGTGEGQTAKIADNVTEEFRARGHEATTVDVVEIGSELDLDGFDAVSVGASAHYGRRQKSMRKWVKTNRNLLIKIRTGSSKSPVRPGRWMPRDSQRRRDM
jgi:menaquinone-dependent protoporphyrinogen oxidase